MGARTLGISVTEAVQSDIWSSSCRKPLPYRQATMRESLEDMDLVIWKLGIVGLGPTPQSQV